MKTKELKDDRQFNPIYIRAGEDFRRVFSFCEHTQKDLRDRGMPTYVLVKDKPKSKYYHNVKEVEEFLKKELTLLPFPEVKTPKK